MLNLELDQASERRLAEEAGKLGITPEHYAALLLQEAMRTRTAASSPPAGESVAEWERGLDDLIEDQDDSIPPIPDEALRREDLYEDRS